MDRKNANKNTDLDRNLAHISGAEANKIADKASDDPEVQSNLSCLVLLHRLDDSGEKNADGNQNEQAEKDLGPRSGQNSNTENNGMSSASTVPESIIDSASDDHEIEHNSSEFNGISIPVDPSNTVPSGNNANGNQSQQAEKDLGQSSNAANNGISSANDTTQSNSENQGNGNEEASGTNQVDGDRLKRKRKANEPLEYEGQSWHHNKKVKNSSYYDCSKYV